MILQFGAFRLQAEISVTLLTLSQKYTIIIMWCQFYIIALTFNTLFVNPQAPSALLFFKTNVVQWCSLEVTPHLSSQTTKMFNFPCIISSVVTANLSLCTCLCMFTTASVAMFAPVSVLVQCFRFGVFQITLNSETLRISTQGTQKWSTLTRSALLFLLTLISDEWHTCRQDQHWHRASKCILGFLLYFFTSGSVFDLRWQSVSTRFH